MCAGADSGLTSTDAIGVLAADATGKLKKEKAGAAAPVLAEGGKTRGCRTRTWPIQRCRYHREAASSAR